MFRKGAINFYLLAFCVTILLSFMRKKSVGPVVFGVCMAYLSIVHIWRLITDYGGWSMDSTTFLMALVCRLSSLGYCISDGFEDESKLSDKLKERIVTGWHIEKEEDSLRNKSWTIIRNAFEILSYTCYPGSNMVGPFFEFRDYKDFIEEKGRYANIPSSAYETSRKLLHGALCIVGTIVIKRTFDIQKVSEKEFFDYPFYYEWLYFSIAMFGVRCQYYSVW